MLLELHVRNLALIEKADVEFGGGLNILTGETGAGKSILIGSVNIALGGKAPRDIVRKGADFAYVELVFSVDDERKRDALKALDVDVADDGLLIISKKITPSRSVGRVNDQTVTAAKLKEITSLFIDIHGQHEHQSLLNKSKHLEILDEYAKVETQPLKQQIAKIYREYAGLKNKLTGFCVDEEERLRQTDFYRFEIGEIEGAKLREGEEEELSADYKRFSNLQKIISSLSAAYETVEKMEVGRALKDVTDATEYDESLNSVREQLYDAEAILGDVSRGISGYMDGCVFDEEEFLAIETRLDEIRGLQAKYGGSVGEVLKSLDQKKKKLEELENYDKIRLETEKNLSETKHKMDKLCRQLSELRKESAKNLTEKIREGLKDLNFIDVSFTMEFNKMKHYTPEGYDEAEFMISTNPGENLKPLGMVASGGELSRIMLAIKAVLADTDDIPTLIFDEIDAGISGRTAQKVSEKLAYIAKNHQVLCITHLPQIAAMADCHYEISKTSTDNRTTTVIRALDRERMIWELARLLGGAQITDAVLKNAGEMKELADSTK